MNTYHIGFAGVVAGGLALLALIGFGITSGMNADKLTTDQRIACLAAGGEFDYSACIIRD